jgi:hypothetical protein
MGFGKESFGGLCGYSGTISKLQIYFPGDKSVTKVFPSGG